MKAKSRRKFTEVGEILKKKMFLTPIPTSKNNKCKKYISLML